MSRPTNKHNPFDIPINRAVADIQSLLQPRGIGGGKPAKNALNFGSVKQQSRPWSQAFSSQFSGGNKNSPLQFGSTKFSKGSSGLGTGMVIGGKFAGQDINNLFGSAFTGHEPLGRQYLEAQAKAAQAAQNSGANRNNFGTQGDASGAQTDRVQGALQHKDLLMKVSEEAGVPWEVLAATMAIETGGRNEGTNPAGATGLMQVVGHYADGTPLWQSLADQYGGDLSDPYTNVRTAAEIMKMGYDQYGSWEKAAAWYFGGGGAFNDDGSYSTNADMYGTDIGNYVNTWANNFAAISGQSAAPITGLAPNERAAAAINFAKQAIGTVYKWGGESYEEGGFDCSGLVYAMYQAAGVNIPRDTAAGYANSSQRVGRGEMQPGDLIFYSFGGSEVDHVSIYIGNGQIIQASSDGGTTHIRSMDEPWYVQHETGYGRI